MLIQLKTYTCFIKYISKLNIKFISIFQSLPNRIYCNKVHSIFKILRLCWVYSRFIQNTKLRWKTIWLFSCRCCKKGKSSLNVCLEKWSNWKLKNAMPTFETLRHLTYSEYILEFQKSVFLELNGWMAEFKIMYFTH